MADVLSKGALFPEELVPGLINQVKGKSAIAALSNQEPIPFNGMKEFTFTFDNEIDIVAENGAKTKGGVSVAPVTIIPVKVEYGARISDEFIYGSESVQLNYLSAFAEGFSRKVAKGLDIMAFHGLNPRTGQASVVIGDNHFDNKVTQTVTASASPDDDIESAIALIQGSEFDVTGLALSPTFRGDLAKQVDASGRKLYPELRWGNEPGSINGLKTVSNLTVSVNGSDDRAIVGDFAGSFRWGYAKQMPIEVIQYGNPDNDPVLGDLKGHNQVYLRGEMYIGWGILAPNAFAIVKAAQQASDPEEPNPEEQEPTE